MAALIAYVLNTAAYLAENIRAGIQSIDKGQFEASKALVYIPAMILYLIITAFFTFIFNKLENKYSVYQ